MDGDDVAESDAAGDGDKDADCESEGELESDTNAVGSCRRRGASEGVRAFRQRGQSGERPTV